MDPSPDREWHTKVTLRIGPHPKMKEAQRRAIERDFGMTNGIVSSSAEYAFRTMLSGSWDSIFRRIRSLQKGNKWFCSIERRWRKYEKSFARMRRKEPLEREIDMSGRSRGGTFRRRCRLVSGAEDTNKLSLEELAPKKFGALTEAERKMVREVATGTPTYCGPEGKG